MNITQMQERLRLELLRRVQRGTLSVSLLARQTSFGQAHLSNFLRQRRLLSLQAMDCILAAQHLTAADLLPAPYRKEACSSAAESNHSVPIVSHATALFEPLIRPSALHALLSVPAGVLASCRARVSNQRRAWQRFVAIRIPASESLPMEPILLPESIALIDRHYNSLFPYRPNRPNLYAVRQGAHLTVRYVDLVGRTLVLRPHNLAFPVELIEIDPGESPYELLTGRIVLVLNLQ
jgi:hypothetical protein